MFKCRTLLLSTTIVAGFLACPGPASTQAATASATMLVSATVLSFCTIATLPLVFGNYSSITITANSSITVSCTAGTTYNISLDVGTGGALATVAARQMSFGVNKLSYLLTSDAAHAIAWGPTIGTNTVTGTATGLPQLLTVYGQIGANQLVAPGSYLDTVTATITY